MKFVSPSQRGRAWTWTCPGTPAPRRPADVRADVHAARPVRVDPARDSPAGSANMSSAASSGVEPDERRLVAPRRDQQVTRRVRVGVHQRERRARALEDHRLDVVELLERGRRSTGPARDRWSTPEMYSERQPAQRRSRCVTSGPSHLLDDFDPAVARRGRRPSRRARAVRLPRAFTPTVPSSASSSPTTSTYGTLSVFARRHAVAQRVVVRVEDLGPEPLGLQRSARRNAYAW